MACTLAPTGVDAHSCANGADVWLLRHHPECVKVMDAVARFNKYVTTLHVLNSTVVKCSKLTKVSSYPPLSAYCVPTPLLLLLRQGDQGLPRLGAGRASRVVRRRPLEQQTRAPHADRDCLLALALGPSARIQAALVGRHRRPTVSSFCAVCTNLATRPRAHHCLSPRPQLLEAQ